MNQTALATAMKVEPQHITNWKARGMPPAQHAAAAAAVGVRIEELLGVSRGTGLGGGSLNEPPAAYLVSNRNKKRLTVREIVRAQSGGLLEAIPQVEGADLGFVETIEDVTDLVAVRVRGDGLSPVYDDGMVLVIKPGAPCAQFERVHITLVDGTRLCKKLLGMTDEVVVVSDFKSQEQRTIERTAVLRIDPIAFAYGSSFWQRGDSAHSSLPGVIGNTAPAHGDLAGGTSQLGDLEEASAP